VRKVAPGIGVEHEQLLDAAHALVKVAVRVGIAHHGRVQVGLQDGGVVRTAKWQKSAIGLDVDAAGEDILSTAWETGIVQISRRQRCRVPMRGDGLHIQLGVQTIESSVDAKVEKGVTVDVPVFGSTNLELEEIRHDVAFGLEEANLRRGTAHFQDTVRQVCTSH